MSASSPAVVSRANREDDEEEEEDEAAAEEEEEEEDDNHPAHNPPPLLDMSLSVECPPGFAPACRRRGRLCPDLGEDEEDETDKEEDEEEEEEEDEEEDEEDAETFATAALGHAKSLAAAPSPAAAIPAAPPLATGRPRFFDIDPIPRLGPPPPVPPLPPLPPSSPSAPPWALRASRDCLTRVSSSLPSA